MAQNSLVGRRKLVKNVLWGNSRRKTFQPLLKLDLSYINFRFIMSLYVERFHSEILAHSVGVRHITFSLRRRFAAD